MPSVGGLVSEFKFENIRLRDADDLDVHQLVPLINEAYSYQDQAKGEPRTSISKLRVRLQEVRFYVLVKNDVLVGCVYIEPKDTALHFGLLTLTKESQGKGIAAELIEAIERFAKKSAYTSLELDYMSLAPWLKKYYEKYGFRQTGKITKWGSIDLVRMSKDVQ